MALNLIRSSRVFVTTNLVNGKVDLSVSPATAFTKANTFEIQVQDGFSFTQNTGTETVTLNEAGPTPIRGQRSFNTTLEPVDWSFSTYIRPKLTEGGTITAGPDADDVVDAEESILWGAMSSVTGNGWTQTAGTVSGGAFTTVPKSTVAFTNSNAHQLRPFGLIIVLENVTYVIHNCAVDSATIDFGLDAIASIQWAGKATQIEELATKITLVDNTGTGETTMSGTISGTAKLKDTSAQYIANKLSTMTVTAVKIGGASNTTVFPIAVTGGSLTISNNLTYLTPANLGVVNTPITYFTGTRAISCNVTAYLKSGGTTDTAALLKALLGGANTPDNTFNVEVALGGATNATKVVLKMPTAMLTIPTVTTEQIISTAITINPQGTTSNLYDLEATNELSVEYYALA